MTQHALEPWNIDEYLREKRRSGTRRVVWQRTKGLESFYKFVRAAWPVEFGYRPPQSVEELHGMTFMGLKHYIRGKKTRVGMVIEKTCGLCGEVFRTFPSHAERRKYCSEKCSVVANKPRWKGDDVGYVGLHKWVVKNLGKPTVCEHCGEHKANTHSIHWANKSGQYRRELSDWVRLCASCHKKYDLSRTN